MAPLIATRRAVLKAVGGVLAGMVVGRGSAGAAVEPATPLLVGIDPGHPGNAPIAYGRDVAGNLVISPNFRASRVTCSVCGEDVWDALACWHIPGVTYDGEVCTGLIQDARLMEVSLVRIPDGMSDDEARWWGAHPMTLSGTIEADGINLAALNGLIKDVRHGFDPAQ